MSKARFLFAVLTSVASSLILTSVGPLEAFAGEDKPVEAQSKSEKLTAAAPVPSLFSGWVQISSQPVTLTPTAKTLWADGLGGIVASNDAGRARSIPADTLSPGNTIHIQQRGVLTTPTSGTNQVTIKISVGTVAVNTTVFTLENTSKYWELDVFLTVRGTAGTSGTISVDGRMLQEGATNARVKSLTGTSSFSPTVVNKIEVTASSSQAITMTSTFGMVD